MAWDRRKFFKLLVATPAAVVAPLLPKRAMANGGWLRFGQDPSYYTLPLSRPVLLRGDTAINIRHRRIANPSPWIEVPEAHLARLRSQHPVVPKKKVPQLVVTNHTGLPLRVSINIEIEKGEVELVTVTVEPEPDGGQDI